MVDKNFADQLKQAASKGNDFLEEMLNTTFRPCPLCGRPLLGRGATIDGTKAGTVHVVCNLDTDKWRKWLIEHVWNLDG